MFSPTEPIRADHRLGEFDCGAAELDRWLGRHALHASAVGSARCFVTVDEAKNVAGYYALAAGSVAPEHASPRALKGQPGQRPIPVVVLARLAVDRRAQGRGVGRSLLQDALLRCATAADTIGVRAVVVHAAGTSARDWYLRFGFEPSPTDPLHLMLLHKDLKRLLASLG